MTTTERPIEERLLEYAVAMRLTASQMIDAAEMLEAKYGTKAANTQGIRDGAKLYGLVAADIDKILDGEELKPFVVTGVI